MQSAAGILQQRSQQPWLSPVLRAALSDASHAAHGVVAAAALPSNPRPAWRGFFVAFSYWFGFYFGGYRQTPARAGARTLLE